MTLLPVIEDHQAAAKHGHGHDHEHDHTCNEHCDHDHDGHAQAEAEHHEHHHHDELVRSFYIEEPRPVDLKKLETWLGELLKSLGENIYRSKGVLHVKGQAKTRRFLRVSR